MPPRLDLYFLGAPLLTLDDSPIAVERRKAVALLAYLAVEGGRPSRESLSALLWPDYEQSKAFTNLRHTLWEIQQMIGEGWLAVSRDKIGLNEQAEIWLDVNHFGSILEQTHTAADASQRILLLEEAARLYRNHFLTGFSLRDALTFNEWAFAESEGLRRQLGEALGTLSDDYIAMGDAEKAIPHARRLITLDPLNEASHRQLMEVYIRAGQHSSALKQYQSCEQILRKELGVDPQPETLALYKRIRKGELTSTQVAKPVEITTPKHNLPAPLSSFIGREKEIDQVVALLRKHRLVTLAGMGGIGKTRLSLQVGQKVLSEFTHGVWFVALDSLSDPGLVPQTIASVFELREAPGRPILETLTNYLRQRTTLLILDNCEHLVEACVELTVTLLTNCPNLKILITSREVLNVTGEVTYQMPSLSIPDQDAAPLEQLTEYESIRLFADRASLALASFSLVEENAEMVIDICRRVDGIPLAIELAAAQVDILQVAEISKQLQISFALLSTDDHTALSRHQTLQTSLDWSWGLLTEAERRFMRELAVFAGGWTLDAAQSVCKGEVLELTRALVKQSLIVVDQGRTTRYRFHEIVRQYAHRKLVESGEEANVHSRHLQYFLQLTAGAELGLKGPADIGEWMPRLNDERDNLRAALRWASKTDVEAGLYITGRLQGFWESFNMGEGARWATGLLQQPVAKGFPHAKAKALHALGVILLWSQEFLEANAAAEESLILFRTSGDQHGEIDAFLLLGHAFEFLDQREASDEVYERARVLAASIGDKRREALSLFRLGYDHPAVQLGYWEKAIGLFREVNDINSVVSLLYVSARFRILLTGDLEKAQEDLDEAAQFGPVRTRNINGLWEEEAFAKSLVALMLGNYEEAAEALEQPAMRADELGNRMGYFWARVNVGYVALRAGDLNEARTIFRETVQNFRKDNSTIGTVFTIEGMAGLAVAVGKPEQAARLIGWADATRERIRNPRPFLEQANVDQAVAGCLAKMEAPTFWAAYAEGQKMTTEKAVSYALNEN